MATYPTVHLNGTSKQSLLDAALKAGDALRVAERALYDIAPHGRDYYVQSNDAIVKATAEHRGRLARLLEISREIDDLAIAISNQD